MDVLILKKLLENDPEVTKLLAKDPFDGEEGGAKYIRVMKYKYKFGSSTNEEVGTY